MPPPTRKSQRNKDHVMPDTHRTNSRPTLTELEDHGAFERRAIGPDAEEQAAMLAALGYPTRAALMDAVVPPAIRRAKAMAIGEPLAESEALAKLRAIARKNRVFKSFIGQGYYGTHTP